MNKFFKSLVVLTAVIPFLVRAEPAGNPPSPWSEPPAVFATLNAAPPVDEAAIDAAEGV